jgi:hypothetical protein
MFREKLRWPKRLLPWLAVAAVAAWATHTLLRFRTARGWWMPDDTYIYLRYVDHFLGGCGLKFNCYPQGVWDGGPVAGYTSSLWVLLQIPCRFLTRWFLPAGGFLHAMSFAAAVGAPLVVACRAPRAVPRIWRFLLAACLLLASTALAGWSIAGLETPLVWAYYAVLLLVPSERLGRRGLAAIGFVAYWIRPDLLLAALVYFVLELFRDARRALWFGASALAGAAANAVFLYAQYRMWLPNTFYAKSGATRFLATFAARNLLTFLKGEWPFLLACGLLTAAWLAWKKPKMAALRPWIFSLPPIAFLLYSGGDIFPMHRHLTPILAALLLSAVALACELPWKQATAALLVLAAGIAGANGTPASRADVKEAMFVIFPLSWLGVAEKFLKAEPGLTPASIVAVSPVGAMGWRMPCEVLDTLGLNDKIVARRKSANGPPGHTQYDEDYVMRVQPDFIFFAGVTKDPRFAGEHRLAALPEFHRLYRLRPLDKGGYYRHVRWDAPPAAPGGDVTSSPP